MLTRAQQPDVPARKHDFRIWAGVVLEKAGVVPPKDKVG